MRYICWLIIAACQPTDDEDIQHYLLALPPPPSHPPHSKEGINLFKRWDKIAKRLILVLAGKARWCQARSFWACVVCCKSDVLAMSCGGSAKSQSATESVISKPLQTLLVRGLLIYRTPVRKKLSSEYTLPYIKVGILQLLVCATRYRYIACIGCNFMH